MELNKSDFNTMQVERIEKVADDSTTPIQVTGSQETAIRKAVSNFCPALMCYSTAWSNNLWLI